MRDEISEISQVILHERQGRDRGWFEQEADCFHPDSVVRIAWFTGTGAEFVERSREVFATGIRPAHSVLPPVVHLDGSRAVAEVPAQLSVIQDFDGVEAYVVNHVRLLYRLTKRSDRWRINAMDCIYVRDLLEPVIVGKIPQLDEEILQRFRRPYMYLGYHLHLIGKSASADLFGEDRPDQLAGLYDESFRWLHSSTSISTSTPDGMKA